MKDTNGQIIESGDRIVYCGQSGSMCDVDVVDRDGVLWGEGPFTEWPLIQWLSAVDLDYCEIVGKTADILNEEIAESETDLTTPLGSINPDDDLPF